jgi:hypothetical protein
VELRRQQGPKKGYPETDGTGQFWRSTLIDAGTRLRVARGIGKTETAASVEVFETLKARGHPERPPALISDGHGGIGEALVAAYGEVPAYRGRGRPPTVKRAGDGWRYLQAVKRRDERGRVVGAEVKAVYGDEAEMVGLLGRSTAYVERTHLTMRHMSGRLVRKGLGFSKALAAHRASAAWEDAVYNLTRPLKTLREEVRPGARRYERRWRARTPAMAAGLTGHVWSVAELLRAQPVLVNT